MDERDPLPPLGPLPKLTDFMALLNRLAGWAILIAVIGFALLWLLGPAFGGYHIGYNVATDTRCLSRIVQWCK